jgi:hypothetical protein
MGALCSSGTIDDGGGDKFDDVRTANTGGGTDKDGYCNDGHGHGERVCVDVDEMSDSQVVSALQSEARRYAAAGQVGLMWFVCCFICMYSCVCCQVDSSDARRCCLCYQNTHSSFLYLLYRSYFIFVFLSILLSFRATC